jgi:hypothetical protein
MARQGELIPLMAEELQARGPMLARMTLELEDLKADHAEERKAMGEAERALAKRIRTLARSIRDGREKDEP